ncbi:MAG TPA: 3-mercaptopyruvate sulfurtransferase [Alphaproteobacteria bacterium]
MDRKDVPPLVGTGWLADNLGRDDLVVVDATYHLPTVMRNARAEYEAAHIPGARFFDIDAIADQASPLPHMLPSPEQFARAAEAMGIGDGDHVVAYDTYGLMSAARAWWMLRVFGHDRVSVLDGGLPKWRREGRPLTAAVPGPVPARHFTPRFRPELVRTKAQLLSNLTTRAEQVVDARAPGRFHGTEPEPRPGLRSGHIPGSRNVPYTNLIDREALTVLPPERLRDAFVVSGVDPDRPVITSCGSGVTACVLALGLHVIGARSVAVYDGSWSEWGLPGDTPVETE